MNASMDAKSVLLNEAAASNKLNRIKLMEMNMNMNMKKQAGFTLIELVMVIVILGVLAAVAIPKFVDLSIDAKDAALQGVVGGLNSANAINYASRSANSAKGVAVTNCTSVANAMESMPTGYTISSAAVAAGVTDSACVLTPSAAKKGTLTSTTFSATGIL